ncbi:MAG: radical SAM protein [Verrucomicrobiae bacterium]
MILDEEMLGRILQFREDVFPAKKLDKVLLVNPPDGEAGLFRLPTAHRKRYSNYPPYGPGVLATHLREMGLEVSILNLNHEVLVAAAGYHADEGFPFDEIWARKLDESLKEFRPDLVGVTCMFTMTHHSFKKVCERISLQAFPLAIGGVHVTNDVERVLDDIPFVNAAFLRESDVAMKNFCRFIRGDGSPEDLGGMILSDKNRNRFRVPGENIPTAQELDVIPSYDLMQVSDLSTVGIIGNFHGFKPKETKFATCLSNRGCRAHCTFCSVRNFNGQGVRQRSVGSVLDELQLLRDDYGIGHITWLDDDLLKDAQRALSLFRGMVKRKLGLTWDATNGLIAAACSEEIVQAMSESGCIATNIGMESGNPEILKAVKKPGTVKGFLRAAEVFRKYPEIHVRVFLMIGFPGETLSMIEDTINVARQMDLDWCGITPLQPLPNTPIYDSMVEQGLIQRVDSNEVRFMAGAYGKQDEIDLGIRMSSLGFQEAFGSIARDQVPTPQQIQDIWFYMNYHLNFHRLFSEERTIKIEQQFKHLRTLSDVISPEHGLALYFTGYLQHKYTGQIDPDVIQRLKSKIGASAYWNDRMKAFGLSVSDLETGNFKNKSLPRFAPTRVFDTTGDSVDLVECDF